MKTAMNIFCELKIKQNQIFAFTVLIIIIKLPKQSYTTALR